MIYFNELHWGQFSQLPNIKKLPLHEQSRQYSIYLEQIAQERLMTFNLQQPAGGGGNSTPSLPSYSGDLTLVFSNFNTVDAILAGGFDSLSDWNTALIQSGNPYTSIVVDEPNYTVYLSGGSNIELKGGAFSGNFEGGNGLGESLTSIIDTGTIIADTNSTFNYCIYLETVDLPALVNVGIGSFQGGGKIKNIQLPSVTSVGDYGFFDSFDTADSPITLYLPLCTSFGASAFLQSDGFGGYIGTTEVDSPKVMNATFSNAITVGQAEIDLLLAENTGVIATYV